MRHWVCATLLCTVASVGLSRASVPQFERDVFPLLNRRCFQCHGEAVRMGDLDLRTAVSMVKGGAQGPALVRGSAEDSRLFQRVVDQSMPMGEDKLSESEIALLRAWIDAGASGPDSETSDTAATTESNHWAFRPLAVKGIPGVELVDQVATSVDAFVLKRLEEVGIEPVPPVDKRTLVRRLFLSLIGLPPTREEVSAFLRDSAPGAVARLVEDLLGRPQYGERWARQWLDVARYAESNGYERDGTKPHAWRYRDYVIEAFNQDKPFDRFLTEQLAGDEIEGSNATSQVATTFLRLGTWDDEPAEKRRDRYDQLDDVLGVAATTFLGLTLRCARCHDHKFEPFSQRDYYQMLAFFEPLKRPQDNRKDLDRLVGTAEELDAYRVAMTRVEVEVDARERDIKKLRDEILPRLLAGKKEAASDLSWLDHAETVLAFRTGSVDRSDEQKALIENFNQRLDREILAEAEATEASNLKRWKKEIEEINAARPQEPPRAYIWYEDSPYAPTTRILVRGEPSTLGDDVQPAVPSVFGKMEDFRTRTGAIEPTFHSTGRRRWLARWMTQEARSLVARVLVNRIWQAHFGEGLVATENDFGVMGKRPSHPGLLDHLAAELIRSGWSVKALQRLIVNSVTFRRSSTWNPQAAKLDPENALLWRWSPRRLEAEMVRDSVLWVTGRLNLERSGPSVYPKVPESVLAGQSEPGLNWGESEEDQVLRRSIYIFVKRSLVVPELEVLDAPDTTSSCEQRRVSTTGPQALIFLNGDFMQEQARHFAGRLQRESGQGLEKQVSRAFQMAFARKPEPAELSAAQDFLVRQQRQIEGEESFSEQAESAQLRALQSFCLTLLNTNEFFYLN